MDSFTPRPLYPQGKNSWFPLNRLGGPKNRSERGGEEKNSQPHTILKAEFYLRLTVPDALVI